MKRKGCGLIGVQRFEGSLDELWLIRQRAHGASEVVYRYNIRSGNIGT